MFKWGFRSISPLFSRGCIAIVGVALCLVSCETLSRQEKRDESQVMRLNLFSEPPTLDPRIASDSTSANVLLALFEGLVRIDEVGEPQLALAKSYQVSDDGLTYTFNLRPAKWSDGSAVTADDFISSWKSTLTPSFYSPYAYQLYIIKNAQAVKLGKKPLTEVGVSAPDPQTLVVNLEYPAPYFLEKLALPTFYPVKTGLDKKQPGWASDAGPNYVSNGPFRLKIWHHHDRILLEKNPRYWDERRVRLHNIQMLMINDAKEELNLYLDGRIDWAGQPFTELPPESIEYLTRENFLQTFPIAGDYWYEFNLRKPPFDNILLRKAFALAINREAIVQEVKEIGVPAYGILPPLFAMNTPPYFEDNDVEGARQLFQQALEQMHLRKNELPSITLTYNSGEQNQQVAQAIQKQWFDAFGINVALQSRDWKDYLNDLKNHQFQIARIGWLADYDDPYSILQVFAYSGGEKGGSNFTQWRSKRYNQLLMQSNRAATPDERRRLLLQAEQLVMEDMPLIPLFYLTFAYVKDPDLKGVVLTHLGCLDFKTAYFEGENQSVSSQLRKPGEEEPEEGDEAD